MRLLNTKTLELHTFVSGGTGLQYAILSHTWGDDELLFDDVKQGSQHIPTHKKGFAKVRGSCAKAQEDDYEWMWIDTCCIDKSSSAELSEAINSMFTWYMNAAVCYAYIGDLEACGGELRRSRWFTRGWTLQELIAPSDLVFLNEKWQPIGVRSWMHNELAEITGVDARFLTSRRGTLSEVLGMLGEVSVATRMGWAAKRRTARPEDIAYCLLGILGVNMPLLYGEGGVKAFQRLQSEVLRTPDLSADHSILAIPKKLTLGWGLSAQQQSVLARHPSVFGEVAPMDALDPDRCYSDWTEVDAGGIVLAADGTVSFSALVGSLQEPRHPERSHIIVLNCNFTGDKLARPGILVSEGLRHGRYHRANGPVVRISPEDVLDSGEASIPYPGRAEDDHWVRFQISDLETRAVTLVPAPAGGPAKEWPFARTIIRLEGNSTRAMGYKTQVLLGPTEKAAGALGQYPPCCIELGYVKVVSEKGLDGVFCIHWGVFSDTATGKVLRPPYVVGDYGVCCAIVNGEGVPSTRQFEITSPWQSSAESRRTNDIVIRATVKEAHFLGRMCFQLDIWDESE